MFFRYLHYALTMCVTDWLRNRTHTFDVRRKKIDKKSNHKRNVIFLSLWRSRHFIDIGVHFVWFSFRSFYPNTFVRHELSASNGNWVEIEVCWTTTEKKIFTSRVSPSTDELRVRQQVSTILRLYIFLPCKTIVNKWGDSMWVSSFNWHIFWCQKQCQVYHEDQTGGIGTTVKLGYNDHGYDEFTAIANKINWYCWSQMATLLQKPSRL